MKIYIVSLLLLVFSSRLYADCEKAVTFLNEGQVSPCTGYLFSPEKELEIRIKNEEHKLLLEQTKAYIQTIDVYKKQVEITEKIAEKEQQKSELWRTRAEDITLKYTKQQQMRSWKDWIYFGVGIVTTVVAGWSLGQVK